MRLFKDLALFVSNISTGIRFSGTEITTLLMQESRNVNIPFINNVVSLLENGYSPEYSWEWAVNNMPFGYGLSKADKSVINQFGCKLGATDVYGQTEHCEYFKNIFTVRSEALLNEYNSKCKVYRCIGIFSGMALSLLIV